MEIIKIIALSLGSMIILFILTKIMGQREMSQLSIFDYITTITIGSIAAETTPLFNAVKNDELNILKPLIIYDNANNLIALVVISSNSIS